MTNYNRRRLSFVDFGHPQAWHKLIEYAQVTIAFTKLITDFTNQWAKICFLASSQLHQLVTDFRKRTETEVRGKCHLGGMMYDLWESLLLESELESQSLKKMACSMEKEICGPLGSFITNRSVQLSINRQHRTDLNEILEKSHDIVKELQEQYTKIYHDSGVTPEFHRAHNLYVLELTGINSLLSKYQYHILPQLLQGMEQPQVEIIDTVCQNLQLIASLIQNYHEQRYRSLASFVVTSTTTNPNEELENYICSMNESGAGSSTPPVHIEFETFVSPLNTRATNNSRYLSPNNNTDQLIVYAAPIIQSQLSTRCKDTAERLKEIKKDKSVLLASINKTPTKQHQQHEDPQQSEKKSLNQMNDFMKKKHHLRLIELEESVLIAQQELLNSHRHSMSGIADSEHDAQKRGLTNIKGLWRDAFQTLKTSTTSSSSSRGSGSNESRLSFARRFSLRKKKNNHNDHENDETIIDPVYETLKIAAETRKMTLANYLQQRQQMLNKQTSLNSQGSSEHDIQSSPRPSRHASRTETEITSTLKSSPYQQARSSIGKRYSVVRFTSLLDTYSFSTRHISRKTTSKDFPLKNL